MEIENEHQQQLQLSTESTNINESEKSINQSWLMVPRNETGTNNKVDHQSNNNQQPSVDFEDDERLCSLPIPEVIEMLKNLAACNEKLYKWEQSTVKLEQIPFDDPNKQQLNEIINLYV